MNELFRYLIQSSVCLAAIYMVYWLFLRKDTFFALNRIYLLLTVLFSLIMPLFSFRFLLPDTLAPVMIFLDPVLITPEKIETMSVSHISLMEAIAVVCLAGVIILTLRFLIQLVQIRIVIRRNRVTDRDGMKLVFVEKGYSPFSFFNLIFLKKAFCETSELNAILMHEKVHIRQFHTIDLILTEILTIVQWFNPVVWLLQQPFKNLHEFLADEGVMKLGFLMREYQQLIVDQTLGKQLNNLTNNFNISQIKNRIIMMTKSRSNAFARAKIFFALPAIFLTLTYFSSANPIYLISTGNERQPETILSAAPQPDIAQAATPKEDTICKVVEKMPLFNGGKEELFTYLGKNIKYPAEAKEKGVQGTVFVTFVIEKDGSVTNVNVLRGIGSGCDDESVRVIKAMPKWTPGYSDGKPVRVSFNLPIKFKLAKEKTSTESEKK